MGYARVSEASCLEHIGDVRERVAYVWRETRAKNHRVQGIFEDVICSHAREMQMELLRLGGLMVRADIIRVGKNTGSIPAREMPLRFFYCS